MNTPSTWFENDDLLTRELRRFNAPLNGVPRIVGYDNLKELRRGGQGIVYTATQTSTKRKVAIKILLDGVIASHEKRRRFEREIDLIATLRHAHIVRVFDSGVTDDGRMYYIMEYIEGSGLDEWLDRIHVRAGLSSARSASSNGTAAFKPLIEMFVKICEAVQHAHQRGVIHRDLKPSNVRIDAEGEPHVLDFGLAKAANATDETVVSEAGTFMGSLPWASPEQADGDAAHVDIRTDVYSLGVVLYQLLTLEFPYPVTGPTRDVLENIRTRMPRPPREINPAINEDLATVTLKCLSKEPERRYQSAGELARDLRHVLAGEPIEARRDSAWYSVRRTLNRYRTAAVVTGIMLFVSTGFAIGMAVLWTRAVNAEKLAADRLKKTEEQIEKKARMAAFLDKTLRAIDPWKHPGRDIGPMREMLDAAATRLAAEFKDQPEVEAALSDTLGWDYMTLGLSEPAEKLLRRSYELRKSTQGEEHPETLESANNLAQFLTEKGDYAESTALLENILAIQKRTVGPEHWTTLRSMNNLGYSLDWQGKTEEAEKLYRAAFEGQTRVVGPRDAERLNSLNNLAICLQQLGRYDEADPLFRELIEIRTAIGGPSDPETLRARMNYAQSFTKSGRAAEGERRLREAADAMEAALTARHPLTIVAITNLAAVVADLGRLDEAAALNRRAYEAQVAFAGPDHPSTLMKKNEFITTMIQMGRWTEAIPLARELREQYARMFGAAEWRTLTITGNLAFALNQTGDVAEAEALWKSNLELADKHAGTSAEPRIAASANLGALYADQSRWPEAEAAFREAIAQQVAIGEAGHWRTAFMRAGLGRVLSEIGRLDEAENELTPALAVLRKALGDDHDKTKKVRQYVERLRDKRMAVPD